MKCSADVATTPNIEAFTFHTHPLGMDCADMPSEADIHSFLYHPDNVMLTVGTDIYWFFIKTPETMKSVRRYFSWRDEKMLSVIGEMSEEERKRDPKMMMLKHVFDYEMPGTLSELQQLDWLSLVKEKLGITVLVFNKD